MVGVVSLEEFIATWMGGEIEKEIKPHHLAPLILKKRTFKTMIDTEEVYVYDNGVYRPNGETEIKELVQTAYPEASSYFVTEVINYIRRSTYVKRSDFDSNTNLINFRNGAYNIETDELLEHDPKHLF